MTIRKGDDTDAFDFGFLTINLENAQDYVISKAEVRIGVIKKTFDYDGLYDCLKPRIISGP